MNFEQVQKDIKDELLYLLGIYFHYRDIEVNRRTLTEKSIAINATCKCYAYTLGIGITGSALTNKDYTVHFDDDTTMIITKDEAYAYHNQLHLTKVY